MKFLAITFIAVVGLSGCANVNYAAKHYEAGRYDYNASHSKALNIAVATGLTSCDESGCAPLADVPRNKLPAGLQAEPNSHLADNLMDALTIGQGVGQMAGLVSAVSGVGNIAGGLLTIGTIFLGPTQRPHPATKPHALVWMPQRLVAESDKPAEKAVSILKSTFTPTSFSGYDVSLSAESVIKEGGVFTVGMSDSDVMCLLSIRLPTNPMKVSRAPEFSGGQRSYVWTSWPDGAGTDYRRDGHLFFYCKKAGSELDVVDKPNDLDWKALLVKLSEDMPEWVYFYLPPSEKHPFPRIANAGHLLLFIQPLNASVSPGHRPSKQ